MIIKAQDKKRLSGIMKKLKMQFKDQLLLKESLTHRSYLNESKEQDIRQNERLEFLGDAVLELITTEYLFAKYPKRAEGELTSFRAAVVRTESLAETALALNFSKYIYMSKGEELTGGRTRPYILANTYEAVLGAIYLDQGYEIAKDFVIKTLLTKLPEIVEKRLDIDSKSKLQELSQELLKETPIYEVVSEAGPDHDKEFEVKVLIGARELGRGTGRSKQDAEQEAAKTTLNDWNQYLSEKFDKEN